MTALRCTSLCPADIAPQGREDHRLPQSALCKVEHCRRRSPALEGEMSGRQRGVRAPVDMTKATPLPLRHHPARRPADAGHRLFRRGQDRDRQAAGRVRHRLCRGRLSRRQPDRHRLLRREAHAAQRQIRRLRHDQARRRLGLQRSRAWPRCCRRSRTRSASSPRAGTIMSASRSAAPTRKTSTSIRASVEAAIARRQGSDGRLRAFLRRLQGQSGLCAGLRQNRLRRRRALGGAVRHQWRHAAVGSPRHRRQASSRPAFPATISASTRMTTPARRWPIRWPPSRPACARSRAR